MDKSPFIQVRRCQSAWAIEALGVFYADNLECRGNAGVIRRSSLRKKFASPSLILDHWSVRDPSSTSFRIADPAASPDRHRTIKQGG
jgi:hypothetical protein